jgi:hypothetical protein
MKTTRVFLIVASFFCFMLLGYNKVHAQDAEKLKKTIPLENIEELDTEIDFPVGGLVITAGSDYAVKGIFEFKKDKWKPEIEYSSSNRKGYLEISPEEKRRLKEYNNDDQNVWALSFSNKVLHDIDIEMGAGRSKINLEGCKINFFEFTMAAGESDINLRNTSVKEMEFTAAVGEATIDLSGEWANNLDAEITGGMGEITLKVPRKTGVKINVNGLLGDVTIRGFDKDGNTYTNDYYRKTQNTLYIDLTGVVGSIEVITVD